MFTVVVEVLEWGVGVVGQDSLERVLRLRFCFQVTGGGLRLSFLFSVLSVLRGEEDGDDCKASDSESEFDFLPVFHFSVSVLYTCFLWFFEALSCWLLVFD